MRSEHAGHKQRPLLEDGTRADYVLCDRHGRSLAVIEAKRFSVNPGDAAEQAKNYARQLNVPYVFLTNGDEIRFWDWQREAYPSTRSRPSSSRTTWNAAPPLPRSPRSAERSHRHPHCGRDYQQECIDTCAGRSAGPRKLLVEMATGTGKTRTAAALIKRLFEANAVTRVLFLVDRIPLAKQTEDAFAEHLPDFPAYVLRAGRRFQDEKRITITTLQSMVNIYSEYSSGYFDLVISDECHRSIYGKWSGVLKHFDGVQIGLTATPCVANPGRPIARRGRQALRARHPALFRGGQAHLHLQAQGCHPRPLSGAVPDLQGQTVKTAADGGFEVKKDELDWSAMDATTSAEFEQLFKDSASITVDPNALERRFTIPERNRAMVREFRQVLENGYIDHKGVLRKPLIGKTIVFAVTKRHAATLAELLDAEFADKKPTPRSATPTTSFPAWAGRHRGRHDQDQALQEGAVPADPGVGEHARYRLRLPGRGQPDLCPLHPFGHPLPADARARDPQGCQQAHLHPVRLRRRDRLPRRRRRICPRRRDGDQADAEEVPAAPSAGAGHQRPHRPTTREWITVDEDGNMVFPEASELKANELGARFEAWLLQQMSLNTEQERWLRLLGSQIRANADTLDEVIPEHFAYFQMFSQLGGLLEARRVFGGAAPLESLLESLNAAVFGGESTQGATAEVRPQAQH
jgi:type I restriction enzyme, R subunit